MPQTVVATVRKGAKEESFREKWVEAGVFTVLT